MSKAKDVWPDKTEQFMFNRLGYHYGPFNLYETVSYWLNWTFGPGNRIADEFKTTLEKIYNEVCEFNLKEGLKKPKTIKAMMMRIRYVIQRANFNKRSNIRQIRSSRKNAYLAGFISLKTLNELEALMPEPKMQGEK